MSVYAVDHVMIMKDIKTAHSILFFFVEEDFTDTDIENFRNAFHIDLKHEINRKNETLESICGACEKKSSNSNFLLILDKQGKLFDLIRF